ncbi:MAG: hypothetical protein KAH56_02130 [Candidatus Krumholzibacteria bacterium]|nr:hypothetical protein [Candidatus Krumholzibacteria bacterium]
MESRTRNRRWRIFSVSAAALLLTVQIGLAVHGASHLHNVGETGDCNLCVLNSHFVAETPVPLDLEPARFVVILPREEVEISADTTVQLPIARGPPTATV